MTDGQQQTIITSTTTTTATTIITEHHWMLLRMTIIIIIMYGKKAIKKKDSRTMMEVKKTLKYTSYPMHNIHLQLYTTYRSNKSFQSRTVDDRRKKIFFVLLRQLQTLDHWVHSMSFSHHHHHVWWQRKTKKIFQLSLRK